MNRHPVVTTLVLLGLAPLAAAQLGSSAAPAPPHSPEKACVDVVVLLSTGSSVTTVSAKALTKVVSSDSGVNMHLLESIEQYPVSQAADFAAQVGQLPGVILAELVHPAGLPEIGACGEPLGTSAEQCTISFADGTPSDAEFHSQEALEMVMYEKTPILPFNQHEPVLVAVIDTGIDPGHPALLGNIADSGWDFLTDRRGGIDHANGLDDDNDGWIDEAYGHGTFLSSVILLINPDAKILPLRVLDADGNGNSFDVADAIYYAADHGAKVINLSLSMTEPSKAVAAAMEYARYKGAAIFAAAGNTGAEKVLFPASYDSSSFTYHVPFLPQSWVASDSTVTAVGATAAGFKKADFSAWGPEVDLVAPGVDIYGAMPGGGYAWWSGTSMATAVASGVGSLADSVVGGQATDVHGGAPALLKLGAIDVDKWNKAYAGGMGEGFVNAISASYAGYNLAQQR